MNFDVLSPRSMSEWQAAMRSLKGKNFRFGAGYTDLLMELKRQEPSVNLTVVNLALLKDKELCGSKTSANGAQIGAMQTAHRIMNDHFLKTAYPVLVKSAAELASTQIRQVATLGGNMCTASPSGDLACAIVALKATCILINSKGEKRSVPVSSFFKGVRTTCLQKDEMLYSVDIPGNQKATKEIHSGFIKVGTRQAMECSVVSLAYHIQIDGKGTIIEAGIAIGAAAPTIRFTDAAAAFLIGKNFRNLNEKDKEEFAVRVSKYASPISDVRATEWYRREVLFNVSKSVLEK